MSEEFNKAEDARIEVLLTDPKVTEVIDRIIALSDSYKMTMPIVLANMTIDTRELFDILSDKEKQHIIRHEALHQKLMDRRVGEYKLFSTDDGRLMDIAVPEKQKPQPNWQDRRAQSAEAKSALIERLKARRNK